MAEEKSRHSVWLVHDTWAMVESHYRTDNCSTKDEFIEKAIRFYTGYLDADGDGSFLPTALSRELDGKLSMLAKRVGRMLFKLAVEQGTMCQLVGYLTDVTLDQLRAAHDMCAQQVKQTSGVIDLETAYKHQRDME